MDTEAITRAQDRLQLAADGRTPPAAVDAALERARDQLEALALTTAELEASLGQRVGEAVQDGLRAEVLPVARHLAEVRGLMGQAIRRLERLEGDGLSDRHARVDDLALVVDLVTSGWESVDRRLSAIEERLEGVTEPSAPERAATLGRVNGGSPVVAA